MKADIADGAALFETTCPNLPALITIKQYNQRKNICEIIHLL